MGMGKTLSTLALIVHSLEDAKSFRDNHEQAMLSGFQRRAPTTLIITPKTSMSKVFLFGNMLTELAIHNWEAELSR